MLTRFDLPPVSVRAGASGRRFLPQAMQLLDTVIQRRSAGGLTMLKGYITLSPSAYAYAISAGGVNIVQIVADPEPEEATFDVVETKRPDFVSGVVSNGTLETIDDEQYLRGFRPTPDCARLFKLREGIQRMRKLAVRPWQEFQEYQGPESGNFRWTQYSRLRASLYSGSMRKLVQLLLGFGRQAKKSIYANAVTFVDDEDDVNSLDETISLYERTVLVDGRQLRYDFRFYRTHGITKDTAGTWWLVEISAARGIIAMPLPLFPATQEEDFALLVEKMSDEAGGEALSLFGGYPTGETFPALTTTFDAWVRAGKIVQLVPKAPLADFYNTYDAYGTTMGWAFNDRGDEAHNTAWKYDENDRYQRGVHYRAKIHLIASAAIDPPKGATLLKQRMVELRNDHPDTMDANLWKIDRLSQPQIDALFGILNQDGRDACYEALDDIEATPLATPGASSFGKAGEGRIFHGGTGPFQQIKFPEPMLGYLLSHDMRSDGSAPGPPPKCDTTMMVFFQGNDLHAVKYFLDPRAANVYIANDSYTGNEDIPIGNFTRETHQGFGIPGMFYSTAFDDREELGESVYVETFKRRDAGYYEVLATTGGSGDRISDYIDRGFEPPIPWSNMLDTPRSIWRMKKFAYEEWRDSYAAQFLVSAIAVPFNDRNAYYYALFRGKRDTSHFYWFRYESVGDPNIGYYNSPFGDGDRTVQGFSHTFSVGSQIWPNHQVRIDMADEGNWLSIGTPIDAITTKESFSLGWYSWSVTTFGDLHQDLDVWLVTDSPFPLLKVWRESRTNAVNWRPLWFIKSPDDETQITQFIQINSNCLGPTDVLAYDKVLNPFAPTDSDVVGMSTLPELRGGNFCIVGVF